MHNQASREVFQKPVTLTPMQCHFPLETSPAVHRDFSAQMQTNRISYPFRKYAQQTLIVKCSVSVGTTVRLNNVNNRLKESTSLRFVCADTTAQATRSKFYARMGIFVQPGRLNLARAEFSQAAPLDPQRTETSAA